MSLGPVIRDLISAAAPLHLIYCPFFYLSPVFIKPAAFNARIFLFFFGLHRIGISHSASYLLPPLLICVGSPSSAVLPPRGEGLSSPPPAVVEQRGEKSESMGRGVSSGGGQSSLGYLFGSGEAPKPIPAASNEAPVQKAPASAPVDDTKQIPAGIQGNNVNNYFRADGQNSGNFITDRPSTKVHAAPGSGSSLDYLFGNGGK